MTQRQKNRKRTAELDTIVVKGAREHNLKHVDIELPNPIAYPLLVELVRSGEVDEARVDRSVARLLRAKFLAGLFEGLRTLRLIHYAAWLARRWHDPAFPRAFPWFDDPLGDAVCRRTDAAGDSSARTAACSWVMFALVLWRNALMALIHSSLPPTRFSSRASSRSMRLSASATRSTSVWRCRSSRCRSA